MYIDSLSSIFRNLIFHTVLLVTKCCFSNYVLYCKSAQGSTQLLFFSVLSCVKFFQVHSFLCFPCFSPHFVQSLMFFTISLWFI